MVAARGIDCHDQMRKEKAPMPVGASNRSSPVNRVLREYYHERCASMREWTEYASEFTAGKYSCTRCGWRWTPRTNSPDPPRACARCRSAYWQSMPVSSRANSPSDPKWRTESQSVAHRRQKRHLTRLKGLAAEFGFALAPTRYDLSVAPPAFSQPQESSQADVVPKPVPSSQDSVPAPRRSLSEEFRRRMAADKNVTSPK